MQVLEKGKITARQLVFILIISRLVIPTTHLPVLTSPPANQDVWLAVLLSPFMTIMLAAPLVFLAIRFPGLTLIQWGPLLLGKAGAVIGFFYVWFFLHNAAITLRTTAEFMTSVSMPETPLLVLIMLLAFICALAAVNGLEVIGRMAELICILLLGAVLLQFVLALPEMELKALQPVLEEGIGPVLLGAFYISPRLVELLVLAMAVPYLNKNTPRQVMGVLAGNLAIFTVFFLLIVLGVIMVFGAAKAQAYTFPYLSLSRIISIGDVIDRIEIIHLSVFIMSVFIKVAAFFYLAVLGLSQLLNLQTYRPLVFPLGALLVALSVWLFNSLPDLIRFTSYQVWTSYALLFITVFPLLFLLVALVRKKKEGSANA
jgi:spore germination protein KB